MSERARLNISLHACVSDSKLPSNISTMDKNSYITRIFPLLKILPTRSCTQCTICFLIRKERLHKKEF